jgi:hypothetical protein
MIAVSFLDALTADNRSADVERKPSQEVIQVAAMSVESVLPDWERVLECEQRFGSMSFSSPAEESRVNRSLYQVYQKWAAEAEQVLLRSRQLGHGRGCVENAEVLEDAFGRVSARLLMTPEKFDRAREQIRQGQGIPMEELRKFRSRVRP